MEEVSTPPSSTAAAAAAAAAAHLSEKAAVAHLSEESAFAALEAYSPVAHVPAAAFEAMEAFVGSQKATGGPPVLPLVDGEEEEEEVPAAAVVAGAAAAAEEEVEEEIAAPFFDVAGGVQDPAEEPAEEPDSQEVAAVEAAAAEVEDEVPLLSAEIGAAPVSAPAIDAAAGVPHFDAAALKSMKVADLRKLASERSLKGYSKMKKAEILSALLVLGEEM